MIYKIVLLLITIIFGFSKIYPTSMVYNFRIAQVTKQFQFDSDEDKHYTVIALFFDQFRKKHTGEKQNFIGGLGSFIYNYEDFYMRMDAAFSHITDKQNAKVVFRGNETDDILFTFGYNFLKRKKNLMTFSALLGVPTHEIHRLQHTDFGYGQTSLGLQLDGSHSYTENDKNIFLYGARYIYFIPRSARDLLDERYKFTIGNMSDLFVADKHVWGMHGLEYGYTAKFRYGAKICPRDDDVVKKSNFIRSNFYVAYRYKFDMGETVNKIFFYLSYGFDHKPKIFGNKYIFTFWTSWNVTF